MHRADIVAQVAKRYLSRVGERAGTFEGGRWVRGTCNVTVSTFQSIYAAIRNKYNGDVNDLLREIGGLNVDESHAQPADTFYAVAMSMDARWRVGMSGTPLHRGSQDSLRTIGALGPVLYEIPVQALIDKGVLSKATIRMIECEQQSEPGSNWREIYSSLIVNSGPRNRLITDIAHIAKKPCMIFVDEMAQGRLLEKMLKSSGVKVDFAHGSDWLKRRQQKLEDLANGKTDVLLCTVIFQEGIDVPVLKSVVNGAGKSSAVASIQRMGRGMRVCGDGDDTFELWDVADRGQSALERHAGKRRDAYQDEGHEVETLKGV